MLTLLIITFLYSYKKKYPQRFLEIREKLRYALKVVVVLFILLCFTASLRAQDRKLCYLVKRNGSIIGQVNIKESHNGDHIYFDLRSDIKTSFIFSITAKGIEQAEFQNGVLVQSYIYQSVNGSEKVNKKLRRINNKYLISEDHTEQAIKCNMIKYNLLCLYTYEPVTTTELYSDKLQKFLPINRISEHHYRVTFGDDNYNDYYYQNGQCNRIIANHMFYTVVMELKTS